MTKTRSARNIRPCPLGIVLLATALTLTATTTLMTATTTCHALKIAFVGDTGMWGEENLEVPGYGERTFNMIASQNVDLVVDVGDFDYWGRCTEEYVFNGNVGRNTYYYNQQQQQEREREENGDNVFLRPPPWMDDSRSSWLEPYTIFSKDDQEYYFVPDGSTSMLKRYKWQYGRHGSLEGWEVGIVPYEQQGQKQDHEQTASRIRPADGATEQRFVITHSEWIRLRRAFRESMWLIPGERDCQGEPWDGPWEWSQFMKSYNFDFLGSSGNVEVKEAPTYGSSEIWADHQRYLYDLYQKRIVDTNRGVCRGYYDSSFPGTQQEYGERFSCFYGGGDHHIIFLGWNQGSDEHLEDESVLERQKSIDFINREFSSSEDRVQNAKWRYCIHHMTSAKLSAGDSNREHMELSGITDACRKHGAIIFNGHHHLYSRTKMLQGVGGPMGDESIVVAPDSQQNILQEGSTMSVTVGMGGYDGACNGKYASASWMHTCVASWDQHRGAVIAEFDGKNPSRGTFRYLNSLADGSVVDQFELISRLPG